MKSLLRRCLATMTTLLMGGVGVLARPDGPADVLTVGNNRFALDLYAQLRATGGNLFFSPYSISTCLAMAYAGARGQTAAEMAQALRFELPEASLHPAFGSLRRSLNAVSGQPGVQLNTANALWAQLGHPFTPAFLSLMREDYDARVEQADFIKAAESTREEINQWVAGQTHDKIKDILDRGSLNGSTRLVLVNAIYFKGAWARKFEPRLTRTGEFWINPDHSLPVPMMSGKLLCRWTSLPACQLLELPYQGNEVSLLVLLPNERDGLAKLEATLTAESLTGWMAALRDREMQIHLPKFKLAARFDLEKTLPVMGMKAAFGPGADFAGLDGTRKLFISSVTHQAFVEVNEEGTEAAAATATTVRTMSVSPSFTADHPFLFLIRDRHSGAILFLGRLTNPAA